MFIFLFCSLLWLIGRHRGSSESTTESAGLRVATDYTPDNFVIGDSGAFGGRQVELATLLLPDTTLLWSLVKDRGEALQGLRDGTIDLYATSIPLSTGESSDSGRATLSLYSSAYVLFCADGTNWSRDFTGGKKVPIYLSQGDRAAQIVAQNICDLAYPEVCPTLLPDTPMRLATRVAHKELKYVVIDRTLAEAVHQASPSTQVVPDLFFETKQVWLVSSHNPHLLDTLNLRIARLQGTPEWQYIIDKTAKH